MNLAAVLSFCAYIFKNAEYLHIAYAFVPFEQCPFTEIPLAPIFYRFEMENKLDQTTLIEADIIKAQILQIGQGRSVSRPAIHKRIGQFLLLYPFSHILELTFVKYFLSVYSWYQDIFICTATHKLTNFPLWASGLRCQRF